MKKSRRHYISKGFTLVELLLGVLLFGIVSSSIYLVFSQGLRIERRLRNRSSAGQDFFWAMHRMVRDLENMVPYTLPGTKNVFLDGQQYKIAFLVSGESGLQEVRYELAEQENTKVHRVEVNRDPVGINETLTVSHRKEEARQYFLVRKTRPFLIMGEEYDEFHEEILSRHIPGEGLMFSYLSYDDGSPVWKNQWQEDSWPAAIRIDLTVLEERQVPVRMVRDVFVVLSTAEKEIFDEK